MNTTSKRVLAGSTAVALTAAMGVGALGATSAQAAQGNKSLVKVLTSDKNKWDKNGKAYDVVTEAAIAVLSAKPNSPVKVLTQGKTRVTAFIPTDRAFKKLASALTGKTVKTELRAFEVVAGLGIDTVETVLLYHVVPGATITAKRALKADGAKLTTAQGGTLKVLVKGKKTHTPTIELRDKDPDFPNAKVVQPDINKGNKQIAHGINGVLLPANL